MRLLSSLCTLAAALQLSAAGQEFYQLPGNVAPVHYDLQYIFDLDPMTRFSYYGVVNILLQVKRNTAKIVLHAQNLSVVKDKINIEGEVDHPAVQDVKFSNVYNFLTLSLDKDLMKGQNYTLTIPFLGILHPSHDGVYISFYVDEETMDMEYLVTTHFSPISARKGFPCFDEPIYKATFHITIGHHTNFSAVSNMPLASSSVDNAMESIWPWSTIAQTFRKDRSQFIWDEFETSFPMSTYLVAFVVSSFPHVTSQPNLSDPTFRIWARTDAIDQTSYAATIGPKVLTHFEKFFSVSFPLPKQDMFAIPDFSAGAMENWGLIAYRETDVLYDKDHSLFTNKENVAESVAHELAHQWFGNLVTMKWWSDLWLSEGFATYAASVGVAAVEPGWHADRLYAVGDILSVLALDALEYSHPVSVPIDEAKLKISEIFDTILYQKGSILIRMMFMFLGEDVCREALTNYLKKYSYSNANQDDFWAELTAVSLERGGLARNVTVKEVMETWTTQAGYPLLTVTRDYTDRSLTITQNRYLSLAAHSPASDSWWVPLSVLCEGVIPPPKKQVQWLANTEGLFTQHRLEHDANNDNWVLFNPDMMALYRVNYDQRNWQLLARALASPQYGAVPVLGRVQLLSDAFALAWSGHLDYDTALQLASYLQRETEYLPLSTGILALSDLDNVLKRSQHYGVFQKFVRRLVRNMYHRAGGIATKQILNSEDLISVKMQTLTSSWACRMKVPGCEENAVQMYQKWMETADPDRNNPIPVDLRRTVYCVGVSRGSVAHWYFALARQRATNVASAAEMLQEALTCSKDVWVLSHYLEWAITVGSEVRSQDAAAVITSITRSTVGYYVAKKFIYDRFDDIWNVFFLERDRMGHIIETLLSQFTTRKELDEFLKWRDKHRKFFEEYRIVLEPGIKMAEANIEWIAKNRRTVVEKLRELTVGDEGDELNSKSENIKPSMKVCLPVTAGVILIRSRFNGYL